MRSLRIVQIFAALVVSTLSSVALAGPFAGLGGNVTFEYASNGRTVEARQPFSLRGGYRFSKADVYLEYSSFSYDQGTPMLSVERTHREASLWARRLLVPEWKLTPFAAAGVGFQRDEATTSFGSEADRAVGDWLPTFGVAMGVDVTMFQYVNVTLEGRASTSSNYAPNPLMAVAFFIGCMF